ncbi:P-loop NTPase family protein [Klebsiella aerogenes]|uniref:hypothetical protein n=1 Tax=Klebsiella aerogenes TaxID=548 RepID=UPI001D0F939E
MALGLAFGFWLQSGKNVDEISAIKSAYAEQARAVTPDSSSDLPRLSINSFSQLGFDVSVTFVDAKGMKYQYFDLIKDGYSVDIKDACRVVIRKGRYLQDCYLSGVILLCALLLLLFYLPIHSAFLLKLLI